MRQGKQLGDAGRRVCVCLVFAPVRGSSGESVAAGDDDDGSNSSQAQRPARCERRRMHVLLPAGKGRGGASRRNGPPVVRTCNTARVASPEAAAGGGRVARVGVDRQRRARRCGGRAAGHSATTRGPHRAAVLRMYAGGGCGGAGDVGDEYSSEAGRRGRQHSQVPRTLG